MSAFVVSALLFLVSPPARTDCSINSTRPVVQVSKVIDGDTLELSDHQRVRLIGINSPELHNTDGNSQPFARMALNGLRKIMTANNNQILLKVGAEKHDRYGRLLAHVFTINGENISEHMLAQGFVARITVPPNNWMSDCYQKAEDKARAKKTGLWEKPDFWLMKEENLQKNARGFYIFEAQVKSIKRTRKSIWVTLKVLK